MFLQFCLYLRLGFLINFVVTKKSVSLYKESGSNQMKNQTPRLTPTPHPKFDLTKYFVWGDESYFRFHMTGGKSFFVVWLSMGTNFWRVHNWGSLTFWGIWGDIFWSMGENQIKPRFAYIFSWNGLQFNIFNIINNIIN